MGWIISSKYQPKVKVHDYTPTVIQLFDPPQYIFDVALTLGILLYNTDPTLKYYPQNSFPRWVDFTSIHLNLASHSIHLNQLKTVVVPIEW